MPALHCYKMCDVFLLCLDKTGIPLTSKSRSSKCIIVTIGSVKVSNATGPLRKNAYSLQVDPIKQVVTLKGDSQAGVFYGIQTLLSLGGDTLAKLPECHITDAPRYVLCMAPVS